MSNRNQTPDTGVTNKLVKRVYEHKNNLIRGFASKYNLHQLVYDEVLPGIEVAIIRENQIKDMNRINKLDLVKKVDSNFNDLYSEILDSRVTAFPRMTGGRVNG